MSRIRGKNTGIERTVFKLLRKKSVSFRRHVKALPGCPDVVVPTSKVAIFLDGDFWHGRQYAQWRHTLTPFWRKKIETNMARDKSRRRKLRKMGWHVVRIWGKDLIRTPAKCTARILRLLEIE